MLAQTCQSVVGLLACGNERSERSGHVLHETGKAFDLCVLVSWLVGDSAKKKKSMGKEEHRQY